MAKRCSFCRVPVGQVDKIIFGTHFNICSDCIRTCLAVLDGEDVTGWTITTSPQRCDNCDRRPAEGYRHLMNRATYSPRICERCIRLLTETLLEELPTLEEELQAIIQNVFATNQTDPDASEEETDQVEEDDASESQDIERDMLNAMRAEMETQTEIDDLTRQAIDELARQSARGVQEAVQTQPSPSRLKNALQKPLGILFDLGDTLLTHIKFEPAAGTAAVLAIANNPNNYNVVDIDERVEQINRDLIPRREHAQVEFHPHIVQRHVYEALNITFDRHPDSVERVFWRAAMQWEHEPGLEDMLQTLHKAEIPMGIVSNAAFSGTTLWWEVEHQGISDFFRYLMSSADYWVRKPHPLLMETAAAKLGLETHQIWYVGNSPQYDVAAALNAGMGAIWYNRKENPLDGPEPHVEVKSWAEFIELFQQYQDD